MKVELVEFSGIISETYRFSNSNAW